MVARAPLPLHELREGAAFVFNASFFMIQAVYVPYAVQRLGLSAFGVGMTLATYGVGMVVGALLAPRIIQALPFGVVVTLGPIAGLAAAAVMVLTIWVPAAVLAALSFFLVGVGPIVWAISTATLRQTVTPRELLGRASALSMTATGARPIGAALGAVLGALYRRASAGDGRVTARRSDQGGEIAPVRSTIRR
jgi:predicted MFS family arabinose efflux permease